MVTRPSTRSLMIAAAVVVAVIASVVVAFRFMGDEEPQQGPRRSGPADIPSVAQPVPCDLMAAPDGDDGADGSSDRPFRTAQQLMQSLQPGQTGCLAAGEYTGGLQLTSGGSDGRPITLAAADPTAERPRLLGRIVIEDSANDLVISGLNLNGRNDDKLPSPTINGDNVVLRGNDISNDNFGICVNPEFLREGNSVKDFYAPPFTLIGADDEETANIVGGLYSNIDAPVFTTSIKTAEMVKYVCN